MCVPLSRARACWDALAARHERHYGRAERRAGDARSPAAPRPRSRSDAHASERYRMLFEASPLPMWVYDAETLALPRRQRRRGPPLRLHARRVPGDDDHGHPPAGGRRGDARRHRSARRPRLADARGRGATCSKDGTLIDVEITAGRIALRGPRAPRSCSRTTSPSAGGSRSSSPGAEDGGDRAARRRRRARLQQPADGDLRLRRDPARAPGRRRARAARARSPTRPSRRPALTRQLLAFSRRQVLHPRVLDLNEIVAGMEPMLRRIIGDDVSVGVRLAPDLAAGRGRPRADRAGDPQPRGQRPRRDAAAAAG